MKLTVLQHETLAKELARYLWLDQKLTDFEKEALMKFIHPLMPYAKIEEIHRKWMRVLLYYFISHIDEEGRIVTLEEHRSYHPLMMEHYEFLKGIEKKFLSILKDNLASHVMYYQEFGKEEKERV